jgi:hypothetical protein
MNSHTVWHNDEKTIVRQVFMADPTVTEFRQVIDDSYELENSVDHTVHIIIDVREVTGIPKNIISALRHASSKIAPNRGVVVTVGVGAAIEMVLSIVQKIYPTLGRNNYTARTLEEAEEIIHRYQLARG